jgi:hypothetical protein
MANKYLVNKHGILHVYPPGLTQEMIELGHREATPYEISQHKATDEQVIARMPPEPPQAAPAKVTAEDSGKKEK